MAILRDKANLKAMREAGRMVHDVLDVLRDSLDPGVSTADLDEKAGKHIRKYGGKPAFKGYRGYPAVICASVNNVVVHGIPSRDIVLKEGDIISIDVGVKHKGMYADAARTYAVGQISPEAETLIKTTERCLQEAIKYAVSGNRLFDISNTIQDIAAEAGYEEVRAFVGHGIGAKLHEAPEVPNWGTRGKGMLLEEGLALAIEPMINEGSREIKILGDGWTAVTRDGKLSAHFEDTVIVSEREAEVIT